MVKQLMLNSKHLVVVLQQHQVVMQQNQLKERQLKKLKKYVIQISVKNLVYHLLNYIEVYQQKKLLKLQLMIMKNNTRVRNDFIILNVLLYKNLSIINKKYNNCPFKFYSTVFMTKRMKNFQILLQFQKKKDNSLENSKYFQ